jgi:hypothetical protein
MRYFANGGPSNPIGIPNIVERAASVAFSEMID